MAASRARVRRRRRRSRRRAWRAAPAPPSRRRRCLRRRRGPARRRARSAADRFWLTFHLPTSAVTSISMPTMARSIVSTKSAGASSTAHRRGRRRAGDAAPSCRSVRRDTKARSQAASSIARSRPRACTIDVVPGRHDLAVLGLARVPGRRDVGLRRPRRRPAHRHRCAPRATPGWRAPRGCAARRARASPASWMKGMLLATMPPASCVTSRPNGCARISCCSTSGRFSAKWAGRYMACCSERRGCGHGGCRRDRRPLCGSSTADDARATMTTTTTTRSSPRRGTPRRRTARPTAPA